MKRNQWVIACLTGMALVLVVLAILFVGVSSMSIVSAEYQSIHFNGQTLDIGGASNVMVQSSNDVRVFAADEQGGVVTVTTSIVTVTVWMKP